MSQLSTLRDLDAIFAQQMLEAGAADSAQYTGPGGGAATACTVFVDRAAQFLGDNGEILGNKILITIFLGEVAAPARRGTVAVGTETFALERCEARDESMERWLVVPA